MGAMCLPNASSGAVSQLGYTLHQCLDTLRVLAQMIRSNSQPIGNTSWTTGNTLTCIVCFVGIIGSWIAIAFKAGEISKELN